MGGSSCAGWSSGVGEYRSMRRRASPMVVQSVHGHWVSSLWCEVLAKISRDQL